MQAHKRIQINVMLKKMPFIDAFKNVPEMLFPVLWADEVAMFSYVMTTILQSKCADRFY